MSKGLVIRRMTQADKPVWTQMYARLFQSNTLIPLEKEIDRILRDAGSGAFIAEVGNAAAGFAEFAIRPYANGCHSKPVPFLEGIWVDPDCRKSGIATALVSHLENYLRQLGYEELGSDTQAENAASIRFHGQLGFEETERVVFFRKDIR